MEDIEAVRNRAAAAGRAVARALKRPSTYPSAVREALFTGMSVALYPVGLLSEALEQEASGLHGRFSPSLPLRYLDPEAAATPIIMLHGYFHNRSAFLVMRRALRRAGFRTVETMNYNVIGHTVEELAAQLAKRVDRVLDRTGAHRVHLVGHSLGGIVARYYIQVLGGDEKTHTCVTMGSPHQGTYAAYAGRGRAARQMRPDSPFVRILEETAREMPVRLVCFYSNLDGLVIPASNAKLTIPELRAQNILVRDQGHLSLLMSRDLIRAVIKTLSTLEGPTDVVTPMRRERRMPLGWATAKRLRERLGARGQSAEGLEGGSSS